LSHEVASPDTSLSELSRLTALAEEMVQRCRRAGADQAEVGVSSDFGLAVNVRMGEVETVERTRDRGVAVTVYFGTRKGSATTADLAPASVDATISQACAIARYTEADPCAGLADPGMLAREFPNLDLWHPWALEPNEAIELGVRCESAGRALDPRLTNSDGASVNTGQSLSVYANSHGFVGRERATQHSVSCALVAEDEGGMQRDYWYDSSCAAEALADAAEIGQRAGRRALARLGARPIATRDCPVLFVPEMARSLIQHYVQAVSGGALYRRASFLLDQLGAEVFPAWFQLRERPLLPRGHGSAAFDSEGVATRERALVEDGRVARYVLGSYSARKLGLTSTGNAGGVRNVELHVPTGPSQEELLAEMGEGLVVTEMMGQGVSIVTGDYSRGAAGFWVEGGRIAHPVEESRSPRACPTCSAASAPSAATSTRAATSGRARS
jgi:PmbA protein